MDTLHEIDRLTAENARLKAEVERLTKNTQRWRAMFKSAAYLVADMVGAQGLDGDEYAYPWVGVGFADEGVPVSESPNVVPPNVGAAVRRPVPPPPPDPPPIRVIKEGQSRPRGDEG